MSAPCPYPQAIEGKSAFRLISFLFPFFRKSYPFGIATNRAIPNTVILLVKRMALFAESLPTIYGSYRISILRSVLSFCNHTKMAYRNAVSFLANMVDNHIISYSSMMAKIRDSMRPSAFLTKVERTISITIKGSDPQLAFSFLPIATIESISLLLCKMFHVGNVTPSYSIVNK